MKLIHVALACRSEADSDRFYQGLLGLRKIRSKTIPSSLAEQVFGRREEFRGIDYADETAKQYARKAINRLGIFDDSEAKLGLTALANFVVDRTK